MQFENGLFKARWWLLALIVALQLTVLILSPVEKTLGWGIKPVYLHVSLTWTGMLLFAITALLGLGLLVAGQPGISEWQRLFYSISLLFYLVGFIISIYASWLNWGGIPWQEPKIQVAVNSVVAAIGAWYLRELIQPIRLKALAGMIPVFFILQGSSSPRMVLHPDNPVAVSPFGIKATFLIMFGLAVLLAIWVVWVNLPGRKQG